MKTFLIVLAVLLLAGVLFFLIGMISLGQTNETVVQINSPLNYTWNLYHDDDVLKEWVPDLQEIELVSGNKAEVDSKYILKMKDKKGNVSTMNETITAFDINKKYAMDYSNEMLDGHVDVLFEAKGDSTVITSINQYKGKTTFLRSMFHFFNGKIISQTEKQYEDFKSIAEDRFSKELEKQGVTTEQIIATPADTLATNGLEN